MDRQHILDEIRRTAAENGGSPLGQQAFERETCVKHSDWHGKLWARWGDAPLEAGYTPNQWNQAYDKKILLAKYVELARELGRLPVRGECALKARSDPTFPSYTPFKRLGSKSVLIKRVVEYCQNVGGYDDILRICNDYVPPRREAEDEQVFPSEEIGFVYLIKSGRFYKTGRTNTAGRREREIVLQLPEKATTVHVIRTDDLAGIEAYWHKRFATNGGANFQLARLRVVSQEGHGGHNHAGGAIAALQIDELTALMACCREWPR